VLLQADAAIRDTDECGRSHLLGHPRTIGNDDGRLDADEYPKGYQHRALHLREHTAQLLLMTPHVKGELRVADEDTHDDECRANRDDIDKAREDIEACSTSHAGQDDEMHGPDEQEAA